MTAKETKIPRSRLSRLTGLAKVGLRAGAGLLRSNDSEAAAKQAAEVLGRLRGLAAKVGQMASYVDGLVPEAQREHYEAALSGLRAAAPRSAAAEVSALIEQELSAPLAQLFAEFDVEPIASASIGQVHRARLQDGREVAVKVQHPGIEHAIDSDLANAAMIERVVGMLGPAAFDSKRMYSELSGRIREELDYRLEAERQQQFARVHELDPDICVPGVITTHSTQRVLTSELVRGHSLEWAAAQPEPQRAHYAAVMWRYVMRGNLVAGLFNADPHPGNYLFREDGSIAFLDYGCVQPIRGERLLAARSMHLAARCRDEAAFRACCVQILGTHGGSYESAALAHSRLSMEPLFASPFRMQREYVSSLVKNVFALREQMYATDGSFIQPPEGILFMNRLQCGFYSVLARLACEVDYARVEEELLAQAGLTELHL
ncbi:MAG TPA: AarF/ABC1/UbiB kinase family protein [Polyangiales bacterium]|nr:AarF/ABC1/UbiB kinase family protein [Polyangiales bacterium]